MTPKSAALLTTAYWFSFAVLRFVGIFLSTMMKPGTLLAASLVVCLLSLGLVILSPHSGWFL